MDEIEKNGGNILAWNPDRLARNSVDGGRIIYLLDTGRLASLKFPTFWCDNTSQGKFMLNMAFGQSKYYVDSLSENTKRGLRQKVRMGIFPSQAPVGYLNDVRTKTIIVDKKRSKIVPCRPQVGCRLPICASGGAQPERTLVSPPGQQEPRDQRSSRAQPERDRPRSRSRGRATGHRRARRLTPRFARTGERGHRAG